MKSPLFPVVTNFYVENGKFKLLRNLQFTFLIDMVFTK